MAVALLVGLGSARADAATCHPYPDVSSSNSACANIAWLKSKGITKPADGRYHPTASVTRGSMAAFLFRLTHDGAPQPRCTSRPFPDVAVDGTFCGYIKWAKDHHIAFGYSDGTYHSSNPVTRGAMAAYLYRIANVGHGAPDCSSKPFTDVPVNDTFCGVITWMVNNKITYGVGGGKYGTRALVTRQAMASFLHRMFTGPLALMGHYYVGGPTIFYANSSDEEKLGVWFVDNEWAYWGRPEHGAPTCTHQTATVTPKDMPGEGWGCVRYRLDAVHDTLTVGPLKGTYRPGDYRHGQLTLMDYPLWQMQIPRAGTRYNVNMEHIGWRGDCGGLWGCTTWTDHFAMDNNGTFVLSRSSITTWGGTGPGSGWSTSFPPDEHGTYRVLSDGRIALHFANGKTKVRTIAIQLDTKGRPDPGDTTGAGGLLLGSDTYWKAS